MPTKPAAPRPRDTYGIEYHELVPGGFYQCMQPGGFSDRATGIHIPGPKAILDDSTRRNVIELTEIPEPIQIPHFKLVREVSESGKTMKEVERDFNAQDELPIHDGIMQALSCGQIRYVPDEVMQNKYPHTWEARQEKYVWRDAAAQQRSLRDLFREAENAGSFERIRENSQKFDQARRAIADRESEMDTPRERPQPAAARKGAKPPPPPSA